jgi:cytidyltransferase-like protein
MKKVLVFGTFDIFHRGHEYFLKEAKKHGDFLAVVVARDVTVENVKKQGAVNDENKRASTIRKSGIASEVVLGSLGDKYEVIKKYKPDIICLGYDQKFFVDNLKEKLLQFELKDTKVLHIDSFEPEIYKSSKLRKKIKN